MSRRSDAADRPRILPLSADPAFVPLPRNPKDVTAAQRAAAFPGLRAACVQLGRAFVASQSGVTDGMEAVPAAPAAGVDVA